MGTADGPGSSGGTRENPDQGNFLSSLLLPWRLPRLSFPRGGPAEDVEVAVGAPGQPGMNQPMPASSNDPTELMKEELMRGGWHRVYLRAMNVVRDLL